MWASGDFAVIGTTLQIVGELLCEAVDVRAGERVLDVAAGNGNATLAAARRFATVTSTDYVPALLERGRIARRGRGPRRHLRGRRRRGAAVPRTRSFDVVLSTFGVMFAPDHEQAARELMRVCRPGGRIGLASWTPDGFLGQLFRVDRRRTCRRCRACARRCCGAPRRTSAAAVRGRGADRRTRPRHFAFRYRSAEHLVDVFRTYYGPIHKAFAALDASGQAALEADLLALLRRSDRGGGAGLVVAGEYLETVITR